MLHEEKPYFVVYFTAIDSKGRHEHSHSIHENLADANFIGELIKQAPRADLVHGIVPMLHKLLLEHKFISRDLRNRFEKLSTTDDIVDELIDIIGLDSQRLSSRHYRICIGQKIQTEMLVE